jgi:hypothetical protein
MCTQVGYAFAHASTITVLPVSRHECMQPSCTCNIQHQLNCSASPLPTSLAEHVCTLVVLRNQEHYSISHHGQVLHCTDGRHDGTFSQYREALVLCFAFALRRTPFSTKLLQAKRTARLTATCPSALRCSSRRRLPSTSSASLLTCGTALKMHASPLKDKLLTATWPSALRCAPGP